MEQKNKGKAWTVNDDTILRREFPNKTTKEVAAIMGRSVQAISVRANILGLKKTHYGIDWTPEMEKRVKTFYPIMFSKPLAKWLGVSHRSLIRKARELGVEKQDGFLEKRHYDIQKLASEALKRSGSTKGRFEKGVHYNLEGEFKKGHKESEETRAKRSAALKASWKQRKAYQNMVASANLKITQ